MDRSRFTDEQLKVIDKAKEYWGTELEKVIHKVDDRYEEAIKKELSKAYIQTGKKIRSLVNDTLVGILETGKLDTVRLYQLNRYESLMKNINKELILLGHKEQKIIIGKLTEAYADAFTKLEDKFDGAFEMPNKQAIKEIVNMRWADRNIDDSIWLNKRKVLNDLRTQLLEAVVLGKSRDKILKEMMGRFNSSYSRTNTLVRTELMRILRTANDNVASQAGYNYKQWLTAQDERVCAFCNSLEDEVFPVSAGPMTHPNCRCTFIYLKHYTR